MKVLMIAAEAVPFAKVGGLGDVLGALPAALRSLDVQVRVVIPKYQSIDKGRYNLLPLGDHPVRQVLLGRIPVPVQYYHTVLPDTDVPVYLVGNDAFFQRPGIYDDPISGHGYEDNGERFLFFSRAALALLEGLDWVPDIIHCHDSQTGMIPAYIRTGMGPAACTLSSTVYTIHNMGYLGLFPKSILYPAGLSEGFFYPGSPLEFYDHVCLMKAALSYADCLNTVSESYAIEIQSSAEFGAGLDGVLRTRRSDLFGIMNGIDYKTWNPADDPKIPYHYSMDDISGKYENKKELLLRCGWQTPKERIPILGMISRLTDQKGFDLVLARLEEILSLPLRLVILGSGNKAYEQVLQQAMLRHPDRISVHLRFDDALAHLIEAGSDMFLMPSKYEPCGLNQLYSMRYGTLPVVRATGGLRDSVIDDDHNPYRGTGFSFEAYSAEAMMEALHRSLRAFQDVSRWSYMMNRAMSCDFSWNHSAEKYKELYLYAISKRRPAY